MRHFGKGGTVSTHHPKLFGHAGYWSKISLSHHHIVLADAQWNTKDKLARCYLSDGTSFTGSFTKDPRSDGKRIHDMRLIDSKKFKVSVEQVLMSKPFGHRLSSFYDIIEEGVSYMDLWWYMHACMVAQFEITGKVHAQEDTPAGDDAFQRTMSRIKSNAPDAVMYLCGPHVAGYKGDNQCSLPMMKHEMINPSPVSLVESLVSDIYPRTPLDYTVENVS